MILKGLETQNPNIRNHNCINICINRLLISSDKEKTFFYAIYKIRNIMNNIIIIKYLNHSLEKREISDK